VKKFVKQKLRAVIETASGHPTARLAVNSLTAESWRQADGKNFNRFQKDSTRMTSDRLSFLRWERRSVMAKQRTHFEQVPVKVAEKVAAEEIKRKKTSSMNTGSKSKPTIVPARATIAISGGLNS
jgi:hypothetical protein